MAAEIERIAASHPDEKGLIHVTYAVAKHLKKHIDNPRFMWHNKRNKTSVYRRFRAATEPVVLVASGMDEGIDLVNDAGRWQIIAKLQYPSLQDGWVKAVRHRNPDDYTWMTVRTLHQQAGRICRTPTDHGVTYILDKAFPTMYYHNKYLFESWFVEALQWS